MIPKILHYCWLSNEPLPSDIRSYIDGWKKLMPDYQLIKWDTSKFDVNSVPFVKQAFEKRKWAFAADYIRAYALYNYGGIYLDSDVEVLKRFDDFLDLRMMLGYENTSIKSLEVAVWGAEKGHPLLRDLLRQLDNRSFIIKDNKMDVKPLPLVVRDLINAKGYHCVDVVNLNEALSVSGSDIPIFPCVYFSPKSHVTNICIANDVSYSIHHFKASWMSSKTRRRLALIAFIKRHFPLVETLIKRLKK